MSCLKPLVGFIALGSVALGISGSASAALPPYDGAMSFQAIQGPSDPEEFSWEVELDPDQRLEQIDDQHAAVLWENDVQAFGITAVAAHDANGAAVPTSLSVSGENVVTLTVHHRAGNPAAGGASFLYPIVAGVGWEGGLSTVFVILPPGEFPPPPKMCRVPKLTGKRLMASRWWLREAGCRLGHVRRLKGAAATKRETPRVVGQSFKPGAMLPLGTPVQVTLSGGQRFTERSAQRSLADSGPS